MGERQHVGEVSRYYRFPLVYSVENMVQSQTDTDLIIAGTNGAYAMNKAGRIVGYSISFSASTTAGDLEFDIEIDGTSVVTIETDTDTTVYYAGEFPSNAYRFDAGGKIGVTYTSDGSLEPETIDAVVLVHVELEEFIV